MTEEFNKWWNEDLLSQDNPYVEGTAAFWAWEGWQAALAQPEQEPVAWGIIASNTGRICQVELDAYEVEGHNPKHIVPLYTHPPQRTWRRLTDEEIRALIASNKFAFEIVRAAETKLKELNHD